MINLSKVSFFHDTFSLSVSVVIDFTVDKMRYIEILFSVITVIVIRANVRFSMCRHHEEWHRLENAIPISSSSICVHTATRASPQQPCPISDVEKS